jgi:hypothetical protein
MDKPETSFDGPSKTGYTSPWALTILRNDDDLSVLPPEMRYDWEYVSPAGGITHTIVLKRSADSDELATESLLSRAWCHVMIGWIPDNAVWETAEYLGEAIRFYRNRQQKTLEIPAASEIIPAVVTEIATRPAFTVEAEE